LVKALDAHTLIYPEHRGKGIQWSAAAVHRAHRRD
jgi:hypothetical protein